MQPRSAAEHRDADHAGPGVVEVHFWAAARAAAGVASRELAVSGPTSLAEVTAAVLAEPGAQADGARLRQVLAVCSVLVDDRPLGAADPAEVVVVPGQSVQYLPPFAGG